MRRIVNYATIIEDDYRIAYERLASELALQNAELFLTTPPDTFLGNSTFSGGISIRDGKWERVDSPIVADVIFNKSLTQFQPEDGWVINHPVLDKACDKDETIGLFSMFCPRSMLVQNEDEVASALKELRTDIIVSKPTALFGGEGIWIGKRSDRPVITRFPMILQEFIDTSGGIPGICDGRHDLRLITFGDRLIDAYFRQPASPDGYLSNVALGGFIAQVPLEKIPTAARALAASVDASFINFPDRVYSSDMGLDRNGEWKLIELNSPPGFALDEDTEDMHMRLLAEHLARTQRPTNPIIIKP